MTLFKYDTGYDYYKALRQNLMTKPEDERPKLFKPSNLKEIAQSLDNDTTKLKSSIVSFYVILVLNYRSKLTSNRQRSLQRANLKRKIDSDISPKLNKIDDDMDMDGDSTKTNRFDCIPDYILKCESHGAKIAVVLYLLQSYTSIKKLFILAILNDHMNQTKISDIVDICKKSVTDIRKYIKNDNIESTEQHRKILIQALIEMSEMLKDKPCSKLAMEISPTGYVSLLKENIRHKLLHSIAPFDALINKYIKECIALHYQDTQRTIIHNQFKVNMMTTISSIIESLPPPTPNKVSTNSIKACAFDPNQEYQYYRGSPNYTKDIVTAYYDHEGKRYKILTYNDCLYDVIGYVYESTDGQGEKITSESKLFDRESWLDRLSKVPYRTKVVISEATGSELNDFNGTADLTVSWLNDSGLTFTKTFTFKKRDKKIAE